MTSPPGALDPYESVLADLRAKRDQIDHAIQTLEALRGAPVAPRAESAPVHVGPSDHGPGAYLGLSIPEAAKKLLQREKRALTNSEIASSLRAGGLVMTSADPVNTVGSVMTRRFHQIGDVVRVDRGTWGLKEWYPNRSFNRIAAKGHADDVPTASNAPERLSEQSLEDALS